EAMRVLSYKKLDLRRRYERLFENVIEGIQRWPLLRYWFYQVLDRVHHNLRLVRLYLMAYALDHDKFGIRRKMREIDLPLCPGNLFLIVSNLFQTDLGIVRNYYERQITEVPAGSGLRIACLDNVN